MPDSGRVLRSLRLGYIGGSSIIWTDSARFMIPILYSTNALCLTRLDTSLQVVSKTIYPASFGEPSSISYSNLTKRYYLSFNNSISDLDVNSAVSNSIIAGGSIGSVSITSDGRYLGYNSISNGGWGGHIVNLETRASTSVNGENGISALSPNGNHFAYESRHGDEVTIKVAAVALP